MDKIVIPEKSKSPMNWHLKRADAAPLRLVIKNHFVAMTGEYVGTVLFLFFAFGGTNIAQIPSNTITGGSDTSQLLYISLCFGFSLAVNAWVFFRISGGLFNPAVSMALTLVGVLPPLRAALLCISQILGGITAAAIIHAIYPGSLNVSTTLSDGCSIVRGLFIEMFLTAELIFTIFMLAAEKHKATFLAPIGIGLALFICELAGVYYTGGSLNPARSFGPAVAVRRFEGYHWIYWVGPFLGALLASGFYKFIKYLEYETVVPDQDAGPETTQMNGHEKAPAASRMAHTGPGMPDLLSQGDSSAVTSLEPTPFSDAQLNAMAYRISVMLRKHKRHSHGHAHAHHNSRTQRDGHHKKRDSVDQDSSFALEDV